VNGKRRKRRGEGDEGKRGGEEETNCVVIKE